MIITLWFTVWEYILTTLRFIQRSKWAQLALLFLVGFLMGIMLHGCSTSPAKVVTKVIHDTQQVAVEKPVLTEKVVTKLIQDPHQQEVVRALMNQNKELGIQVNVLHTTVASLKSEGGGIPTVVPPTTPSVPPVIEVLPQVCPDPLKEFKDWQLDARYTNTRFDYTLDQKFRVVSSSGRDKQGQQVGFTEVYQVEPQGQSIKVPAATTVIFADESVARWLVSPRIQAGLGVGQDKVKSGVVALQWLKHGKSKAAEDVRWAIGSPSLILSNGKTSPGVLTFSFNAGTIKHSPFTNVWFSHYLDTHKKMGIAVTATF
jgi:hypothetical protein